MTSPAPAPALAEALDAVRRAPGVQHVEVRAGEDLRQAIGLRSRGGAPALDRIVERRSSGVGVRVLVDGAWGFAAAAADEAGVVSAALAVDVARRAVEVARATGGGPVRLAEAEPQRGVYRTPVAIDPFAVPEADKLAELEAAVRGLGGPGVRAAQASMTFRRVRTRLLTSDGVDVEQELVHGGAGMKVICEASGEVAQRSYPMDFDGGVAARGYEQVRALDLGAHAPRIRDEARALCAAPLLPAGRRTIILSSPQLALQIHESCGHPTEGDRAYGEELSLAGGSFLGPERLGRFRYGSRAVNLVADATAPGGTGTFGWDDEGTPARRTQLVARGQFVGYLTSREVAARLGLPRSGGCVRAESWARAPIIRMTNVSLEPGEAGSLEDLLADSEGALLFGCNRSWSIDDLRLDFQFGCEIAWEVRGGKPAQLFRNPIYRGRTPRFWGGCDAVCGPEALESWGFLTCGKGDPLQTMWVGHGCAPARFRDVEVGHG